MTRLAEVMVARPWQPLMALYAEAKVARPLQPLMGLHAEAMVVARPHLPIPR